MALMTDYLENALINHCLRNTAYTPTGTIRAAMFTSNPGESGSLASEVGTRASVSFSEPSGGSCSNSAGVTFNITGLGTINYVGIVDATSGGNLLFYSSITPATGDLLRFTAGQFAVTMSFFQTAFANKLLDHILRGNTFSTSSTMQMGLQTSSSTASEVSGNGYSRQDVTFSAPSNGTTFNSNEPSFTASGGNWGTITHASFCSDVDIMFVQALSSSRVINNGDSLTFEGSSISVGFA
jgi:hypothetical protein